MAVAGAWGGSPAGAEPGSLVGRLGTRTTIASTVPGNGDVNPYGVAIVPRSVGRLHARSTLVSNFNNQANQQGTGTTIVEVSPDGQVDQFARIDPAHLPGSCPGGIGLTTALTVLRSGWVIVGSLPTADGTSATAEAGCLLVLDAQGQVVETWAGGPINGPWDLAAIDGGDQATLFVTNVLNGTVAAHGAVVHGGTLIRITVDLDRGRLPQATSIVTIATGFAERTDPAALVVGPTGVAVDPEGTAYVADTASNRLAAVPHAPDRIVPALQGGRTVSRGGSLNGPLGLTLAPDGHLLSVNAGDGNLVETTPFGQQIATRALDTSGAPPGAGALFGLAFARDDHGILFVDDADNTLNLLHR
jgi:sugar lactone lactonase YvrE